ncbi:MAG: methionine adenosyltransferase domain-containing protein [Betaproteobacteria bacterium]|nr:methionine adenosyltransferase domain-containing protein [Betaproteobacteria bacterium]
MAEPVSYLVETFGTGQRSADEIVSALQDEIDLTPAGILKTLDLRWPIDELTTTDGHFGRQRGEFSWEREVTTG